MNDKQAHNNFFTEGNSPVPLIPPDHAWEAMQVKLNEQLPQKKKRRMLLWLPPVGCAFVLLLLLGGYSIWKYSSGKQSPENRNEHIDNSITAVAEKSKAPGHAQPGGTPSGNTGPNDQPIHNDTATLTATLLRSAAKEQEVFAADKTTSILKRAQHRSALAISTNSPKHKQHSQEKEDIHITVADTTNDLRPSPPAGSHDLASILIQPARTPKPAWLPEDPLTNVSSGKQPANKIVFAAGLQVEVPVPVSSIDVYFKNPDAQDRFYQPLSPGIWGSISRNRHRITGEFKPFASALLPNKTFQTHMLILPDGTLLPGDKKLVKVFGTQVGLQYTYQVNKHWWVGAGVDISMWRKALILSEGLDSMLNMSRMRGVHKNDAPYLNAFQPGGVLHLAYEAKVWTGMLQIGAPFKPTVKPTATVQGLPVPVWARLGVRLRLLQSKNATVSRPIDQVRHHW